MQAATDEAGRVFREAWIAGVRKNFPGEPKPGYVTPWDNTPDWERQAAAAVYSQVQAFVQLSAGNTARLTREQKSRFVATCWIAQIYKHIPDPKPAYVADWDQLPEWQQQTDADIFEHIENQPPVGLWLSCSTAFRQCARHSRAVRSLALLPHSSASGTA